MTTPSPRLTPKLLKQAAIECKDIETLEALGRVTFQPYSDAIAAGTHKDTTLRNTLRRQGYSAMIDELCQGLVKGKNSRDGRYHVFQEILRGILYAGEEPSAGESSATKKLTAAAAIIPSAQYIDTTIELLKSSQPAEVAIGIAAATGRRCIEVVQIGIFSEEEGNSDAYLKSVNQRFVYRFANPAKKRNYGLNDDELPSFSSTSLVPVADLLAAHKKLRDLIRPSYLLKIVKILADNPGDQGHKLARDAFNKSWKDALGAVVKDKFSFLPGKIGDDGDRLRPTPKDLRPAFAQLSYVRDVAKDSIGQPLEGSEILFKGRILGHYIEGSKADETLRRLSSTLSYYGYRCDAMPIYPDALNEPIVRPACYQSDRDWLNSLVKGKGQAETFRYLRQSHEALQAEVIELRAKLRESAPLPASKPASQIEHAEESQGKAKRVAVPTAPTARLENPAGLTEAQKLAFQWIDMVVSAIADHNRKANGDISGMWAFSSRLLKDVSHVSQRIVGEYWAINEERLVALNEASGLDGQHNRRRGMKGASPSLDFNLIRPANLGGRR